MYIGKRFKMNFPQLQAQGIFLISNFCHVVNFEFFFWVIPWWLNFGADILQHCVFHPQRSCEQEE